MHRRYEDREPPRREPEPEIDHCTGSSLTGAGHGQPRVLELVHDYMAWFRQHFLPNG